jgi:type IV pilus assembly protein PilM
MFGLGKMKEVVGLDIGSYAVKAVEFKSKKKGGEETFEVEKIGLEFLPHDAIVEGTIMDSTAVSETIKMIFDENKISNKNVVISQLSDHQKNISPLYGDRRAGRIHHLGSKA